MLLPLFKPDLGGVFPLLHFLVPAGVHLADPGFQLTLKFLLATVGVLLNPGLFLRKASVKFKGQFLLTPLQLVFKLLFALLQRLGKLQLLQLQTVLLLPSRLLQVPSGVLLGLRQFEGKGLSLQLQLRTSRIAGVRGFLQLIRQPGRGLLRGQIGIGHLAAGLKHLGSAIFRHLQQFLVMFLGHSRAFGFVGGMLGIQFLTHLGQTIRPGILAQLNLAFNFQLLEFTQGVLLNQHLVERIFQAGTLGDPLIFLLFQLRLVRGGGSIRGGQCLVADGNRGGRFTGHALGAQNLLSARAGVEPMQAATEEAKAMSGTLLLGLEEGGETDLNHQGRQESDEKSQHRINPDAHHADLVSVQVAALLGRGLDGDGAFTQHQAAHDFHRGGDAPGCF